VGTLRFAHSTGPAWRGSLAVEAGWNSCRRQPALAGQFATDTIDPRAGTRRPRPQPAEIGPRTRISRLHRLPLPPQSPQEGRTHRAPGPSEGKSEAPPLTPPISPRPARPPRTKLQIKGGVARVQFCNSRTTAGGAGGHSPHPPRTGPPEPRRRAGSSPAAAPVSPKPCAPRSVSASERHRGCGWSRKRCSNSRPLRYTDGNVSEMDSWPEELWSALREWR